MGYIFIIGEREDYIEEGQDRVTAGTVVHSDSPDIFPFENFCPGENKLIISYTSFDKFAIETGLSEVMVNTDKEYLGGRPGYIPVTMELVRAIDKVIEDYEQLETRHPWCSQVLNWFQFWVQFSLETHKNPVIVNH